MSRTSVRNGIVLGLLVGFALITACAGRGEIIKFHVYAIPAPDAGQAKEQPRQLAVLVQTFTDQRPQRALLGVRTHFWGGLTRFEVEDGRAGDVVARVLADYLKQRGWAVSVGTWGSAGRERHPDVVISGEVLEFSAKAKSRFGSTLMTTRLKLTLKAHNMADGTAPRMNVDEKREDSVFWFNPEDLERLVNQTLQESLHKAMTDLKVADGSLRMQ